MIKSINNMESESDIATKNPIPKDSMRGKS